MARTDTGLEPGDLPAVLAQLAGRRPCYPVIDRLFSPPVAEYVVPEGLLALHEVARGEPFFMEGRGENAYVPSLATGVYAKDCDFATLSNDEPGLFFDLLPGEAEEIGATHSSWRERMQVLYTSGSLIPPYAIGLSPGLSSSVRAQLERAILEVGSPFGERVDLPDRELASGFASMLAASGIDLSMWLEKDWTSGDVVTPGTQPIEWRTPPPGTAVFDVPTTARSEFAVWGTDSFSRLLAPALSAGLTALDSSGNVFPVLALDVPSVASGAVRFEGSGIDEQLVVEYRLRRGLTWHDGAPLTSDDLVFTWRMMSHRDWPFTRHTELGLAPEVYVTAVEAPDDDRALYHFMSERQAREAALSGEPSGDLSLYSDLARQVGPVVPFNYLALGNILLPEHLLSDVPPARLQESGFEGNAVFAGPYRLVRAGSEGGSVVLQAFEGFALGQPSIRRVVFGAAEYGEGVLASSWQPPELLAAALEAGAISAQLGLPGISSAEGEGWAAYAALESGGTARVEWAPLMSWETLDFNLANPHLADRQVRLAIARAIDREALIAGILGGRAGLMRGYLPNWHPLYAGDAALPDYEHDPEAARDLLRGAGYDTSVYPASHPARGELKLDLASMETGAYSRPAIAEMLKEDLSAIGIEVTIEFYSWPMFEGSDCRAVRNGRRFDLALAGWRGAPRLYPVDWVMNATLAGSIPSSANGCPYEKSNWSGWRNSDADRLYYEVLSNGRVALERPDIYQEAWAEHQRLWAVDLPSLPLFNSHRPVVVSTLLRGVRPSPFTSGGVEDSWNIYEWNLGLP